MPKTKAGGPEKPADKAGPKTASEQGLEEPASPAPVTPGPRPSPPRPRSRPPRRKRTPERLFPIVGVGASAGGLEAFTQLLENLPLDTGMGFVLVQHLAPRAHSMLPEILAKVTRMPVTEVRDGMRVEPNRIYVTPPDITMSLEQGVLHLTSPDRAPGGAPAH